MEKDYTSGYNKPKIISLSGAKALAMILLFWWHCPIKNPKIDLGGWTCVFLFVVSGFLVGYNFYGKSIEATWKNSIQYVLKKLVTLWPLHFIVMLTVWLTMYRPLFTKLNLIKFVLNIFLLQAWNPVGEMVFSFNAVSWFLACLVFCYFMAPVLWKICVTVKKRWFIFLIGVLVLAGLEWASVSYPDLFNHYSMHTYPVARCLEFFLGMLIVPVYMKYAMKMQEYNQKKCGVVLSVLQVIFVMGMAGSLFCCGDVLTVGFRTVVCLIFIVLIATDTGILCKILSIVPLRLFSNIQFEFFLIHSVVIVVLGEYWGRIISDDYGLSLVLFINTIIIAVLYHLFLAKPLSQQMKKIINWVSSHLGMSMLL